MALAHVIVNKVEAAYRRGDLFAKRRRMMQAWADYLLRKRPGHIETKQSADKAACSPSRQ